MSEGPDTRRHVRRRSSPRRSCRPRVSVAVLLALLGVAGCSDAPSISVDAEPWRRTEERERCADYAPLRAPYFGDLHVHTRYSADAYIYGSRGTPRDAYAFARGDGILVSDENEEPTRSVAIDRPLDFAAVTDHSEFIGEVNLCLDPSSAAYDEEICRLLRQADHPDERFEVIVSWLFPAGIPGPPPSLPFCAELGLDCDASAGTAWADMQAAAEEAYDRTSTCGFTSFVGYENTASLFGRHMHRNVIFRNERVPALPASHLETEAGGVPQGVWSAIENGCLDAGFGCDAVVIPHNSNLSGGEQFLDPLDVADARRRRRREPLVEVFQHKGSSECRFDRLAGRGVDTEDELCAFEQLEQAHELPGTPLPSIEEYPRRNLVRNALKDGLAFEERWGANPFQFGLIGSTDTHDATAGAVAEANWPGAQGNSDATVLRRVGDNRRQNPGGLAVLWAEENSRDALFSALARRETYATSGTRPIVRFFAGDLEGVSCERPDTARRAYETGTPMGGEMGPVRGNASPRFFVHALADPGTASAPGTPLQRIQVVKGWIGADGQTHERVFEAAGRASPETVDPATCAPLQAGTGELCAEWEDPDFDRGARAFYYARVLEVPTCRWNTLLCKQSGVDPFSGACLSEAAVAGEGFEVCCSPPSEDPFAEAVIQERAWTSPIWYRPEGIAEVQGEIRRVGGRSSVLSLDLELGALSERFDPAADPIRIAVGGDAEIQTFVLDGGALQTTDEGSFRLTEEHPALVSADLDLRADGSAALRLTSRELDLSPTGDSPRMIRIDLRLGEEDQSFTRLWTASDRGLATPPRS
jgi:hypothetical protein